MFYTFYQNNSYGIFEYEENKYSIMTIIEADNKKEAIKKAKELGIYFDGVNKGIDCPCCDDRWYNDPEENDEPKIYGKTPKDFLKEAIKGLYFDDKPNVIIHYKNGGVETL